MIYASKVQVIELGLHPVSSISLRRPRFTHYKASESSLKGFSLTPPPSVFTTPIPEKMRLVASTTAGCRK